MATLQVSSWRALGFALGTLGLPLVFASDLTLILAWCGRDSAIYQYFADYGGEMEVIQMIAVGAVSSMFPGALWGWMSGWCVHLHLQGKRRASRVWSAGFGLFGTLVSWLGIQGSWRPSDSHALFDAFGMALMAPLLVWSLLLVLWSIFSKASR